MDNKRQFTLGVFFLLTLSLLATYTLLGTDTLHLFSDPILMEVYFPEAHGLREGDPVQVAGMRAGRVKSIVFDANEPRERQIHVTVSMDQELELLEDYGITIRESTALGGRHVYIDMGTPGGKPHDTASYLRGSVQKSGLEALGEVFGGSNGEAVSAILADARAVMAGVRAGEGVVGRLLVDEEMAASLATTVSNLESTTGKIDRGEGLLGALINDPEMTGMVKGTLQNLETMSADLAAGKGLAGRLIYDEALANEVQTAIEAFSSVGQKIDRGEGLVGRLVSDEEMATQFEELMRNFRTASEDIAAVVGGVRAGEGSLGKLLMDQELYDEALIAVKLLTRSLEDYREAAPVTAFTSVLFEAF